jgi:acetyl/propionyl-CoA carboxylase alpha subunit
LPPEGGTLPLQPQDEPNCPAIQLYPHVIRALQRTSTHFRSIIQGFTPKLLISNTRSPIGHAVEARLYAEDPSSGFLPAAGLLLQFIPPTGPGIRVDTGFQTGDTLTTYYDPLIAKIIVLAENRPAAIRKMQIALRVTVLLGLTTNLQFLQTVLAHPIFQAGQATTRFIENHLPNWQPETEVPLEALLAAALASNQLPVASNQFNHRMYSPWEALTNFRLGSPKAKES